jgi:putative thioredoxin
MTDPRMAPSIFTRGAVDLGALARNPAAQQPQAAPAAGAGNGQAPPSAGASSSYVVDVTDATFQEEVLQRSLTTPVIIDFVADWCEPCKQLSPVLERLAEEAAGAFILAKIDVDASPRIAQTFRVQSIPLVYAVVQGQPIPGFNGVLPEAQVRQFVDEVLKAAGIAVESPEDPRLLAADDAMADGDLDAAEQAYKKILAESPADVVAESGLAQVGLLRRTQAVNPAAVLAAADDKPDDLDAQLLAADVQILQGDAPQAYQRLVALVRRTSGDERERARLHLLSLFAVAGPDDPAVAKARRALASALF